LKTFRLNHSESNPINKICQINKFKQSKNQLQLEREGIKYLIVIQ